MSIIIYGASDDLLEVEGDVVEEFDVYAKYTTLRLNAPNGYSLLVSASFTGEWELSVKNDISNRENGYPAWNITFVERPDREGDPAIIIDTPPNTTVTLLDD